MEAVSTIQVEVSEAPRRALDTQYLGQIIQRKSILCCYRARARRGMAWPGLELEYHASRDYLKDEVAAATYSSEKRWETSAHTKGKEP